MLKFSTLLASSFFVLLASAQPGQLVNSFGDNGLTGLEMPTVPHEFKETVVQADGKIVCVGYMDFAGESDFLVCRFLDDGTLDPSFGTDGILRIDLNEIDAFWAVRLQANGKILATGLTTIGGENRMVVARVNTDGTMDATYGNAGFAVIDLGTDSDRAWSIAVQADGKAVIGGSTFTSSNNFDMALVRLNTDGSLDASFAGNGWTTLDRGNDCIATELVIQDDGKIVVSGWGNEGGDYAAILARYTSTGVLDASFNGNGVVQFNADPGTSEDEFYSVKLRTDQKLVAMGTTFDPEGDVMIAQFNADGSPDMGFGANGSRVYPDVQGNFDKVLSGYLRSDGKIILCGLNSLTNGDQRFLVMRTEANGDPDLPFGADGRALYNVTLDDDVAIGCAMAQNGDIIAAGFTLNNSVYNGVLLRFNGSDFVGIDDQYADVGLRTFPVPFNNRLTVQFEWSDAATPVPVLLDALGKNISTRILRNERFGPNSSSVQLALPSDLPSGVYIVQVVGGSRVINSRVLKE